VSKCWIHEKTNWREIALFQPKPAMSGCTGLCPVCQAGSGKLGALGNKLTAYDYNSSDCPVCTGLSGEPTVGRAIRARHVAEPTVGRGTGLSGAPTAPRRQRSASPNKEGDPHQTVSGAPGDRRQELPSQIALNGP
jgi:hypothetical protein